MSDTGTGDATTGNRTDPELADELVAAVRDWVRKDVVPVASDYEHEDRFPEPLVAQMRAFGLFGSKWFAATSKAVKSPS